MYKWQTRSNYREKNRDRILTLLVLFGLIILLLVLLMQPAGSGQAPVYVEHVVSPGETLWNISQHYRPDADPREIIWLIQEASGCTALIRPGQVLRVPVHD